MCITEGFLVFMRCSSGWGFAEQQKDEDSSRIEIQVLGPENGGQKGREREERRGRSKVPSLTPGERLALIVVLIYMKFLSCIFRSPTSW